MSRLPALAIVTVALLLLAFLGAIDVLTGYEFSFSLFYLAPILLAAWYAGRRAGLLISLFAACTWYAADLLAGHVLSSPFIGVWNALVRLTFFLIINQLVYLFKRELTLARSLSRQDFLTGAINGRYFFELTSLELERSRRTERPLTLAYLDLDNFKQVNDTRGHQAGDQVLTLITRVLILNIRKLDLCARLGGDEFALLLPETDSDQAQIVIERCRTRVAEALHEGGWPISLSIGCLTCLVAPASVDDLLQQADTLMYSVKQSGKNSVCYAVSPSP